MRKLLFVLALPLLLWALPAQAANCNAANGSCWWVGGTGTWDGSTDSAHWANSSNGASCSCEPSSTALIQFDANSGGGTVTMGAGPFTFGGSAGGLTLTGFTGTLTGATNNPTVTITSTVTMYTDGSGTHTIVYGTGTWTFNNSLTTSTMVNFGGNASATLTFTGSNFVFNSTGASGGMTWAGGAKSFNNVTFKSSTAGTCMNITGANTFASLTLTGPVCVGLVAATTQTVSTTLALNGATGSYAFLSTTNSLGTTSTIAAPASATGAWVALRDITFTTNAPTFTNCFNLGHVSLNGGSCTAPSGGAGGGGAGIIGG